MHMGTRTAPFVFLLLTACMAADGTSIATWGNIAPDQAPALVAPARAVVLPAIPRMRPNAPRKSQTALAPVQSDAGETAAHKRKKGAAGTAPPAGPSDESAPHGDTANASSPAHKPDPGDSAPGESGPPVADAEPPLPPKDREPAETADAAALPEPAPELPEASLTGGGLATRSDEGGPVSGTVFDLAALAPAEADRGIDVESLFDGDVVRYCAAMWQMGEYVGAARRRGEPFKQAIGDAVKRIADEKQLPLDNRLAFSGQVYGRLIYRLDDSHAARTLGAYVHFACLTVRGDKKIVPADPDAERSLNSGLAYCEDNALLRDDLNACLFRELTPIVDRRNG